MAQVIKYQSMRSGAEALDKKNEKKLSDDENAKCTLYTNKGCIHDAILWACLFPRHYILFGGCFNNSDFDLKMERFRTVVNTITNNLDHVLSATFIGFLDCT